MLKAEVQMAEEKRLKKPCRMTQMAENRDFSQISKKYQEE
jgi:hypothetical protein